MTAANIQTIRLCDQASDLVDAIGAALLAVDGMGTEDRASMRWLLTRIEEQADTVYQTAHQLQEADGAFERGVQQLREGGIEL